MRHPNNSQCDICADRGPCFYCGRSDIYTETNYLKRLREYEAQASGHHEKGEDENPPGEVTGRSDDGGY